MGTPFALALASTSSRVANRLMIFIMLPVYAAMQDIDGHVVRAALVGAGRGQTLRALVLPLAMGGIGSGALIVPICTLGFLIPPAVLGGGRVNPISIRIERSLSGFPDRGGASVLGILLLTAVLLIGAPGLVLLRLRPCGIFTPRLNVAVVSELP